MTLRFQIRPATPEDERALRACAEAAYARYVPRIGRRPAPMDAPFADHIARGYAHVAEDATGPLGYVVFWPVADHMTLDAVAVFPQAAGRGIGAALIRHCEACAYQAGLGLVRLYTNAKMVENLSMYPRLGYAEIDRRRQDGFDRVFFEKALAPGRFPSGRS